MRALMVVGLLAATGGCAYVSKAEFDQYWDADGDGWPIDDDCNDQDERIFPFAEDFRGDGCDADCGREPDADGDDWPDDADCGPNDPDRFPCSPHEVDGDGVDSDCDGSDGLRADACDGSDPDFPSSKAIGTCGGGA